MRTANLEKLFQMAAVQIHDPRIMEQLEEILEGKDSIILPEILLDAATEDEMTEEMAVNLAGMIREMSVPQKIKLAMLGNMVARGILIRDTNWLVAGFVLQNPRITENEVYDFARNSNLDQAVNREISSRSEWTRNYAIKLALTSNPKTPIDISIKWIKYLQVKDLRNLAKSKGIPQVIVGQCRKLLESRQKEGG